MSKRLTFLAELSEAELAVRVAEAAADTPRPEGMTAECFLQGLDVENRNACRRVARAAILYFKECLEGAKGAN